MNPLLELLPICYVISVVCVAIKEEKVSSFVGEGVKFFLQLYFGIVSFGAALYLLCQWIR
ncbi:MAG: hypothetical protein QF752_08785 [Planctomycetota bacterium]|jgi:hypothetical protein|nr:hypothetical protein [Planctomycetota bacterium]